MPVPAGRPIKGAANALVTIVTLIGNLIYVNQSSAPNLTATVLSISGALLLVGMAREGLFGVLPAWRATRLDPVSALTSR